MQARERKQTAPDSLLFAAGVVLVSALLARRSDTSTGEDRGQSAPKPPRKPPERATDEETHALARMLESETKDPRARVVIGWITLHAARAWRKSLVRLLTGRSGKYGHQKYFYPDGRVEIRYASTVKEPGPEALRLARDLLAGRVRPPRLVEQTKPTAYVELTRASKKRGPDGKPLQPAYNAARILKKQRKYGGIVARVNNWFLYAQNAKPIADISEAIAL